MTPNCRYCGRFISHRDMADGKAIRESVAEHLSLDDIFYHTQCVFDGLAKSSGDRFDELMNRLEHINGLPAHHSFNLNSNEENKQGH